MVDIVGAFLFFTWLLQVDAVPLQCANDSTTNLSSNIEYVMRDCNGPASPVLVARNGDELTNVTITVTNGNVLPRLRIMNHTAVRGLTVHIENVTWLATVNDAHRLEDATGVGDTVLLSIRESAVANVSVVVLHCRLAITNNISAGVAPTNVVLLEVMNNDNSIGRASNVSLAILNSSMNFTQVNGCCTARYNATGSSLINIFNDAADIQQVHITLQDVTVLLNSTYQRYFGPLLINSGGEKSLTSAATNVTVICSRASIIMRLTMCPTGCGDNVTMYGGLVYLQANSIRYFMMTVENATMTLQPAVLAVFDRDAKVGTQLWASVAVIIPDNGTQSHVSHVAVVIMSSAFTIAATMGASLLNVGNFTEVNDTSLVAHALTTLMSANGRIIDDTAAMIRCSAIIICLAATVQRLDVAIDGVDITAVLAVGHPTVQLASLVPQLGVVAAAAMVLTGSFYQSTFSVSSTHVFVNMTHGFLDRTFNGDKTFVLEVAASLMVFYPPFGHLGTADGTVLSIISSTVTLGDVSFTATSTALPVRLVAVSTSALSSSLLLRHCVVTISDVILSSNSSRFNYTLPAPVLTKDIPLVVQFVANKTMVFDNSVYRAVDLMPQLVRDQTKSSVISATAAQLHNCSVVIAGARLNTERVTSEGLSLQLVACVLLPAVVSHSTIVVVGITSTTPAALSLMTWIGNTNVSFSRLVGDRVMHAATLLGGRGNLSLMDVTLDLRRSTMVSSQLFPHALLAITRNIDSGAAVNVQTWSNLPQSVTNDYAPTTKFSITFLSFHWYISRSSLVHFDSSSPFIAQLNTTLAINSSFLGVGCDVRWLGTMSPFMNSQLLNGMGIVQLPSCTGSWSATRTLRSTVTFKSPPTTSMTTTISRSLLSCSASFVRPPHDEAFTVTLTRPVLGVASAAAAAVFLASGGAAVTAAADMQALLALGMSNCAPSVLRESSGVSLYLLSPFYALGLEAMALGNIGLFVMLWLVQLLVVLTMERAQRSAPVARRVTNAPNPADNVRRRLKYPNLTYAAGLLLLQGSLSAAMTLVMNRSGAGEIVAGAAALVLLSTGIALRVWAGRRAPLSLLVYSLYPMRVLRSVAWVPTWVLPVGEWTPQRLRETHGRFRSSVRGGAEWMCEYATIVSMCVAVIGALPVPEEQCYIVVPVLLFIVYAVTVTLVARVQPARAPLANVLQALSNLVMLGIALCMFVAGIASNNAANDTASSASAAISALSFAVSILSALKAVHALFVAWWLRKWNRNADSDCDEVLLKEIDMALMSMVTMICRRSVVSTRQEK